MGKESLKSKEACCTSNLIYNNILIYRTTIKNGVKRTEVFENDKLVHHSEEAAPTRLTNRTDGHFIQYKY